MCVTITVKEKQTLFLEGGGGSWEGLAGGKGRENNVILFFKALKQQSYLIIHEREAVALLRLFILLYE